MLVEHGEEQRLAFIEQPSKFSIQLHGTSTEGSVTVASPESKAYAVLKADGEDAQLALMDARGRMRILLSCDLQGARISTLDEEGNVTWISPSKDGK